MTLLNRFNQEMHQSALVVSVLGVGQFGKIRDVKANRLFILGSRIHDVSHQQDQLQNFTKLSRSSHFLTSLRGCDNVRFAVLNQFGIVELELERFESWNQPLDVRQTNGELLSFSQVFKLTAKLLELVQLVGGGKILDQRLKKILREYAGVAAENTLPQVCVTDVLQSSSQDDGQVLGSLGIQNLQFLGLLPRTTSSRIFIH